MSSYKEILDLRITCADEWLFPPLERNYSYATECARFYGMPVRQFYKERERYEGDDEPYVIWKIICSDLTFVNRGFTCRIEVESISGITAYKRRPP